MKRVGGKLTTTCWLLVLAGLLESPAIAGAKETPAAAVARVAALIDARLAEAAERAGVSPAPPADDAEFLRRACLDLGGRIPAVSEVRDFLRDPAPDKRRRKIDMLLNGPRYVSHFAQFWQQVLLPDNGGDELGRFYLQAFENWLQERLRDDTPYNVMVWDLLNVPLDNGDKQERVRRFTNDPSPLAFYQARQVAPENLAASTARIFLGVRIECAQCHNHPFDVWKQEQFWGFAAFFAGIERRSPDQGVFGRIDEIFDRREIGIPGTGKVVQATYLDGSAPRWRFRVGSRQTLADWITSADNRYFSRMAVNRFWAHLFGRGLVEPIDDFTTSNLASQPALLDDLAREFVAQGFDLKFLLRAIMTSQAYQRTSRKTGAGRDDPALFARMAVKALTAEQVLASLHQATGQQLPASSGSVQNLGDPAENARADLLEAFEGDTQPVTERPMTVLQALAMMNGGFTARAVDSDRGRLLSAVLTDPAMQTSDRIDTLYLATLSRFPTSAERQRLLGYVQRDGAGHDAKQALGDVFWALLNSTEFVTNH
jgi:hypothetical protein